MSITTNTILRILFYTLWILLGIWQAYSTDLLPDEALYWKFSQCLDWGYLDQPPMVAVLIKLGYSLLQNELGVRLVFVFMSAGTIGLLERLIQPHRLKLFYTTISSIAVLQLESFLAIPDVPLLFYVALYFLLLKNFYKKPSIITAIFIGLCSALMLYAKYHGILVIVFTILANYKLLASKYFWIATLTATLVLAPHIIWQVSYDFPSLQYHFYSRGDNSFRVYHTINYLLSALIFFGPFVGFIIYWSIYKYSAQSIFEKTLKLTVYGTLLFFLLLTLRGNIEANWLLLLAAPLTFIGYFFISKNERALKWHKHLLLPSLVLVMTTRFLLAYDVLPDTKITKAFNDKFHSSRKYVQKLKANTNSLPIVFVNSYRRASIYHFYSGIPAISRRSLWSRKTQFDIWDSEEQWRGKKVILVPDYYEPTFDSVVMGKRPISFLKISNFQPSKNIVISARQVPKTVSPNQVLQIPLAISNIEKCRQEFSLLHFFKNKKGKIVEGKQSMNLKTSNVNGEELLTITCPSASGAYKLYFGAKTNWVAPTINSKPYSVLVQKEDSYLSLVHDQSGNPRKNRQGNK